MGDFDSADKLDRYLSRLHSSDTQVNEKEIKSPHPLNIDSEFAGEILSNRILESKDLKHWNLSGIKLYNCIFRNVDFTGTNFFVCTFQNCTFENCDWEMLVLRKCEIKDTQIIRCRSHYYVNISESFIYSSNFLNCSFDGIIISGTDTSNVHFQNTFLSEGKFFANFTLRERLTHFSKADLTQDEKDLLEYEKTYPELIFDGCQLGSMEFRSMNFIDSFFKSCELSRCSFVDCELYEYNLDNTNNKKGWGTNSIDLNTLIQSKIPEGILKIAFNIDRSVQLKIRDLLSERKISSVFISYSLKDNFIANAINDYLKKEGVTTFLWEKDSPGGQPLRSIMKGNIHSKDRVLFIASENSLKSKACQYEITEGRKKQDELWRTVLFPIHIDNFLFEIDYDQIRPKNKRDEYWENIQDLRDINSLDFIPFSDPRLLEENSKEFDSMMNKLLDSLRIEKSHL